VYSNIYSLVIGKVFKASTLGHYTRAQGFAILPSSNLTGVLQRVTFPMLCLIQDDDERLASVYRRILKLSAFVIFPLMTGLAAIAKPMVLVVLGEKWMFTATLLQIICFAMMWYPIHAINLNLLYVKGRSDLFLKLEIVKKILGMTILAISVPFGITAMCVLSIFSSLIALAINTYYTGKLIGVGYFKQMRDLMPTFTLSVGMSAIVYLTVTVVDVSLIAKLAIGVIEGALIYVGGAKLFHFAELTEAIDLLHRNKKSE
jgi:O-antigen/teichoic acid export membrane protein